MALNTGIPQEDFEHMLTLIQSFYPPGVGARDLRECLLIQLKREGRQNSLEYRIMADHMEDLGKRRFPEIARRMGITVEQVQKCANNIAQLDPRPGADLCRRAAKLRPARCHRRENQRRIPGHSERRTNSASAHQQHLQGHHVAGWQRERSEGLHPRQNPERKIPDQIDPPAPADDFQHRARDREAAARVFRARHIAVETDDHGADRGRGRRARDHGEPRHFRQIHGHAAGRVRDEIFLHARLSDRRAANR